jgi:ribosomal protein L37AE/L43A
LSDVVVEDVVSATWICKNCHETMAGGDLG